MSASHHNPAKAAEAMSRFLDQVTGKARREYPAGRMGAEDDGALSYAMASDNRRSTIIIRFGKSVEWIGLGIKEAEELRDQLEERLLELRGLAPSPAAKARRIVEGAK